MLPALIQARPRIPGEEYCLTIRRGNLVAHGRCRVDDWHRQDAVPFNSCSPVRFNSGEPDCWVIRWLFQETGVELAIQQVCAKSIVDRRGGVDIDGGTGEIEIHGYCRDVFDMVVVLVGEQDCFKFQLSGEGQAGGQTPGIYSQYIVN